MRSRDPLTAVPAAAAAQLGVDPRGAVPALRFLVDRRDLAGQLGVLAARCEGLPARAA